MLSLFTDTFSRSTGSSSVSTTHADASDQWHVEVFYDGDCPLCRKEIAFLRVLDRKGRIRFTDIASSNFDIAEIGLSQSELMAEIHGRLADGTILRGVEVFRRLYAAVGLGPVVWASRLPVISGALDWSYNVFARNRLRLTGRCQTGGQPCELTRTAPDQQLNPGGISKMSTDRTMVIEMLRKSYSMELETVMNYLANSINLDGVRAEEIKKSLAADIAEEVTHAQMLGRRIKQLGGVVPGSQEVEVGAQQQPPEDTTDVVGVIEAVIEAEKSACEQYNKIIKATDGSDYVTQDLCIRLLADEEEHLILFRGYLKEYRKG